MNPNNPAIPLTMTLPRNKVPEVTLYFWIIKILSTTVGETFADFLATSLGLGLVRTSVVMTLLLLVFLTLQLMRKSYEPWSFWIVVILISVMGTVVTDLCVDQLGLSLINATLLFGTLLMVVFFLWYGKEKTLAMKSITSLSRELFYWSAVLMTFALGTATGDLLAEKAGLGYGPSAIGFALAIAMIAFVHHQRWLNGITGFWLAYILTRPLGASLGDLLSQAPDKGGFGWGPSGTSAMFLSTILLLVIFLTITRKDVFPVSK